jgi:hypothetical protein
MHFFISVLLLIGFCFLLVVGLLNVLQDLLERDFHAPPRLAERDVFGDRRRAAGRPRTEGGGAEPAPPSHA